MDCAFHIDALIESGLLQARPHTSARCKVNHLIKLVLGKHLVDGSATGNVRLDHFKWLAERLQILEVSQLDIRVVKIIQIIQRPNMVSRLQEPLTNMEAD